MVEPEITDIAFATAVVQDGKIAICYWFLNVTFGDTPLVLFSWSCDQFTAQTWIIVQETLDAACERVRVRFGVSGVWAEGEGLAQLASNHGLMSRPIPTWITGVDYWPRLGVTASGFIMDGKIKLTDAALEKAEHQAFGGIGYKGGERNDDPTVAAFLFGITAALDESASVDPKAETLTALAKGVAAETAARVAGML